MEINNLGIHRTVGTRVRYFFYFTVSSPHLIEYQRRFLALRVWRRECYHINTVGHLNTLRSQQPKDLAYWYNCELSLLIYTTQRD